MSVKSIQSIETSSANYSASVTQSKPVEANQTDASWFSAAFQQNQKTTETGNVAERIVGQLSGSSEHLQKLSNDADRALKKASKSNDAQDVVQANRALSSFYLESLLTTKLISKGTQAVEKLTSLQ
ncbi:EscI/YscI/HrpB family type III secretion system inner rod protein [Marinomonas sp. A3A]|uniref:type III secretion system inner rod subunit SctI n=1 Tax=Marinomonas sp. A3A TaxID=2065312 RepID=UPI001BB3D249|nr:type III secretion system inner rod subunit SctI [Marinomonas sp. A3A]QUX90817.1 EscI/YscI/HrpB family type III secretion system inner rod protein [Marinomonas sp. A3A]